MPDPVPHTRLDAETLYETALNVSLQWFRTWDLTGNRRHLLTAMICSGMARERFDAMLTQRRARRLNKNATFMERLAARQAELEALVAQAGPSIIEVDAPSALNP